MGLSADLVERRAVVLVVAVVAVVTVLVALPLPLLLCSPLFVLFLVMVMICLGAARILLQLQASKPCLSGHGNGVSGG